MSASMSVMTWALSAVALLSAFMWRRWIRAVRAAHQKRFHQVKVVWQVGSASAIPLFGIGFLEALGALPIVLHPVFVAAVEGQL